MWGLFRESVVHILIWLLAFSTPKKVIILRRAVHHWRLLLLCPTAEEFPNRIPQDAAKLIESLSTFALPTGTIRRVSFLAPVGPASYAGTSDANHDPEGVLTIHSCPVQTCLPLVSSRYGHSAHKPSWRKVFSTDVRCWP